MKCPHCITGFNAQLTEQKIALGQDAEAHWTLIRHTCSECGKFILYLDKTYLKRSSTPAVPAAPVTDRILVRPKGMSRPPCPTEVPVELSTDYTEACLVLADSPKASAALSRRCLQSLLREAAGVKPGDLSHEIQQVIESTQTPSHIAQAIDAVRNIGNFAAHPMKSKSTGEILPVEPEEAEWTLDVLEALFDFYYVQPAILGVKRQQLNEKLQAAGKPPMK